MDKEEAIETKTDNNIAVYLIAAMIIACILTISISYVVGKSILLIFAVLIGMLLIEQVSRNSQNKKMLRIGSYLGIILGWVIVLYGPFNILS